MRANRVHYLGASDVQVSSEPHIDEHATSFACHEKRWE